MLNIIQAMERLDRIVTHTRKLNAIHPLLSLELECIKIQFPQLKRQAS